MEYPPNEIKIALENYRFLWYGIPKIGKTVTFKDFILEEYGSLENGLLLSIGDEVGYKTLAGIYAKDCPSWSDFVEVVDDLIENKESNKFKMIGIDTIDELFRIAENKVLGIHFATKGEKAISIKAALGGWQAGEMKTVSLIAEQIGRLEKVYGTIYIGHTKTKNVSNNVSEEKYEQITGSLPTLYANLFGNRADFTSMFAEEVEVKDDRKISSKRYIYLRGNTFIDAGSRMEDSGLLPDKVEMSAKNYIKAIRTALEKSTGKTSKEIKETVKEEKVAIEKKGDSFISSEKSKKASLFEDIEQLLDAIAELVVNMDKETASAKKKQLEAQDLPNSPSKFKTITDLEIGKKVYNILKSK